MCLVVGADLWVRWTGNEHGYFLSRESAVSMSRSAVRLRRFLPSFSRSGNLAAL
jgi:hypothetical protein